LRRICATDEEVRPPHNCMNPYVTIQLRLAYLYVNQVANAIVRMDDRLTSNFKKKVIDWSIAIDVLGTPDVDISVQVRQMPSPQLATTTGAMLLYVIRDWECMNQAKST